MNRSGGAVWACVLTLLVASGAPAFAQEPPVDASATDYTEFGLDQLMAMDVVYGAASYDQKITDAPAAVTVITADEIRAYGYRTLADVLASVRGFHVTYDRSYDYIGVRGFGRPGDYNTRVLILHDGHPTNDIIYGTAPVGPELSVNLDLVKRIEIIRGPGSALYGAGAFFAVVNMVTYDGDELGEGEVVVEYGSRRRLGGRVTWGGGGPEGSLLLSASGHSDDGDDIHWPEYDDPSTNNGLFVDGDREKVGHLYGKYRRGGLQATASWARRDKRIPTAEWGMIFNDTGAEFSDERLVLDVSGTHEISAVTSLRGRLSYDDYVFSGDYPYDFAEPGDPLERVIQLDSSHGRWWSGELQWASLLGGRHRVVAGADFRKSTTAHQQSEAVDPYEEYLAVEQTLDNAGVYVQDEWSLGGSASLYAGLRYDTYRSFGGNLTPRCGLVTHVDARTTAKLLYGEAFRAPNAYEMYYDDGMTQKGNPDLEPERIRTWEVVLERELGRDLRASLSVFDNEISGLIDQVTDPADMLLVFANVDDVVTRGVEVDLDARLLPGLRGRFSFSAQRAEYEYTGDMLTNAPTHLAKLNLSTPRRARALAGALEVQYVSRRQTLSGAYAPEYAVANLDVTWWTPLKGLQVDLAVDNALDQRYSDPGAGHQLQDTLAREGRLVSARLGWRW
jgi:iron complex outermembrane receptor protein